MTGRWRIGDWARLARDRRGAAGIEFAFALPLFVVLAIGMIDVGRGIAATSALQHAARQAARFASIHGATSAVPAADAAIVDYARARLAGAPAGAVAVAVAWAPDAGPGSTVSVRLDAAYAPLLAGFLPLGEIAIAGSASRTVF